MTEKWDGLHHPSIFIANILMRLIAMDFLVTAVTISQYYGIFKIFKTSVNQGGRGGAKTLRASANLLLSKIT